jgi:hypothetical protein
LVHVVCENPREWYLNYKITSLGLGAKLLRSSKLILQGPENFTADARRRKLVTRRSSVLQPTEACQKLANSKALHELTIL